MSFTFGYKPNGYGFDIPEWSRTLRNHYWIIRVESKDKAKRRRYYRYIAKEKLRLAELGIDQVLIEAVCRHLCDFSVVSGNRMMELIANPSPQITFDFFPLNDNNRAI